MSCFLTIQTKCKAAESTSWQVTNDGDEVLDNWWQNLDILLGIPNDKPIIHRRALHKFCGKKNKYEQTTCIPIFGIVTEVYCERLCLQTKTQILNIIARLAKDCEFPFRTAGLAFYKMAYVWTTK